MSHLPQGWTRKTSGTHTVEWSIPGRILVQFSPLVPSMPNVRVLGLDLDDRDMQFFDKATLDQFIEILGRAWRQVEHFKAGAKAPLSEEEEARDVPVRVHRIWIDGVERDVQPGDEALLGLPEDPEGPVLGEEEECA